MKVPASPEEITVEWLDAALGDSLGAGGVVRHRGPIEPIGEELGFASSLVRLRPIVDGRDGPCAWPVIVKLADAEDSARELAFYRVVAPVLPIRVPRFLGGAVDAERDCGVVLLAPVEHDRQGDVLCGVDDATAERLAVCLADLHASHWDRVGTEAMSWLPRWTADGDAAVARVVERRGRFVELHAARLGPATRARIGQLERELPEIYGPLQAVAWTVVHDDFHLDNVLFDAGEPVVLDWQTVKRGPAAVDVARFLVECLDVPQRRRLQERSLSRYAARLRERGVEHTTLRRDVDLVTTRILAGIVGSRFFQRPLSTLPKRQAALIEASLERVDALVEDLPR